MERTMNINEIRETENFWHNQGLTNFNIPVPEEFNENGSHKITGDGSITPTTHIHKSAIFLDEAKTMFATPYAYANNKGELQSHVVRFGINGAKAFPRLNPDKLLRDNAGNPVEKSKLSQSKYGNTIIQRITHEELEINLIQEAINRLLEQDKKTVLVDIFARHVTADTEQNGKIKLIDNETPETHTVVLYRVDENTVFLIDPSNYFFSSHIANANITNINNEVGSIQIQVPSQKGYKIYSPFSSDKTGYSEELWRDCIDIAVKLAFLLNTTSYSADNLNKIRTLKEVKLVSNQDSIDEAYFCTKEYPIRKKQKSDITIIKKFQSYLKKWDDYHDNIDELDIDKIIKSNKKISDTFLKPLRNTLANIWKKYCSKQVNTNEDCSINFDKIVLNDLYKNFLEDFQTHLDQIEDKAVIQLGENFQSDDGC